MLGLMQIINYMYSLGLTETAIRHYFEGMIEEGSTVNELCDFLGIELSRTVLEQAELKVSKWESALFVIKMKQGA